MTAYYNEIDAFAAQWLRNLIDAGHIAAGDVDERSIVDVQASDLDGYTQCHFFAGIGVWSHALRNAGWSDDREVWTGSCPCQPFSAAGRKKGTNDDRHLWPEFFRLIQERSPSVVLGEQVASKAGLTWLDLVQTDLEGANYASAAFDLCAAGVGAPHIRQRLFWVADNESSGRGQERTDSRGRGQGARAQGIATGLATSCADGGLGESDMQRREGLRLLLRERGPVEGLPQVAGDGEGGPGPVNGHWDSADWVLCRDPRGPRWRPVAPGSFPLAYGFAGRVGRLRAYGNAIVAPLAEEFVKSYMECRP